MSSPTISRIAVFCGSRVGENPAYAEAACELGSALARRQIGIVYGGAQVGMMGALAKAALAADGEVIGVIPSHLVSHEVAHSGLSEQHIVPDMHVRKRKMMDLADAFIALPGGAGTFEEWFEAFTWRMLRLHRKRCMFLNIAEFYTPLLTFLAHCRDQGFIPSSLHDEIESFPSVNALIETLNKSE